MVVLPLNHQHRLVDGREVGAEIGRPVRLEKSLSGDQRCLQREAMTPILHLRRHFLTVAPKAGRELPQGAGVIGLDRRGEEVADRGIHAIGIGRRLQHEGGDGCYQQDARHPGAAVAGDVPSHLAGPHGMADKGDLGETEVVEKSGQIVRQRIEIIAAAGPIRPSMSPPVIGDTAQAMAGEKRHLIVPGVRVEDIGVHEDDRLPGSPILVEEACAVAGLEVRHVLSPVGCGIAIGAHGLPDRDVAGCAKQGRQRVMPSPAIGTLELDGHDILVALPGLVEHEAILQLGIAMQDRFVEHGLAAHGIEDASEKVEERFSRLSGWTSNLIR